MEATELEPNQELLYLSEEAEGAYFDEPGATFTFFSR